MDTVKFIEGDGRAAGRRFALVVARYHDFVTDRLQAGALSALAAAGATPDGIVVVRVPGAHHCHLEGSEGVIAERIQQFLPRAPR